jgi:hypothetical protein
LTVILLGFNNGWAGRMTAFAQAQRGCGAQPVRRAAGVRASAAAAVRCRGKASGRRVVRRVLRGRVAPAFCCVRQLSRRVACAVTRRQARGALGAPLKT